jgi:uncharacterized protein (TIGR03382 family)
LQDPSVVKGIMWACLLVASTARAQSINVHFGPQGTTPSAGYAAAGGAGTWNTVTGIAGTTFDLVATDGSASGVQLSQTPTTTLLATTDPAVSGDDAKLLDNGLVTSNQETCLMFTGFQPGMYEVLVYAWLPNQPTVKSRTRQDEAPSTIDVGGAWSGSHEVDVTYARYVVSVSSDGMLPAHSGLVPGMSAAALNGVQIRPLAASGADAGIHGDAAGADAGDGNHATGDRGGGCDAGGSNGSAIALLAVMLLVRRRRAAPT